MGDEGLELLPFSAGSRAICVERDAESDAYLHEKVIVEQFKLLQPLCSTRLKQALISELVGSLVEGVVLCFYMNMLGRKTHCQGSCLGLKAVNSISQQVL